MYRIIHCIYEKVRDTDARTLDHKQLTELRIRGVKAVQAGQSPADVAAALGVNRTTVYDWLALYSKGGWHALRSDHHGGRTWARKGVTPVVSITGARFGFNMIPAVSPRGQLRFMVVEGRVNAA